MRRTKPVAIIDIGSNSVRLVVYSGAKRAPNPIFNEKLLAGLGRCADETGRISAESWDAAVAILKRFKLLLRHMKIREALVVATAAVRDASNGPEFVAEIESLGFDCRVLDAEEEAWLAGEGVLSAIPDARGIVADLGGGSLELVEVTEGISRNGISLPLGVLRATQGVSGEKRAAEILLCDLKKSKMAKRNAGLPLYLVGGSWRALAKIDMILTEYPLPATHAYTFAPDRIPVLRKMVTHPDPAWAKRVSTARLASTPVAAMVLDLLVRQLSPSSLVISSFGIREGLLFSRLRKSERELDPLIEAARDAGGSERRFGEHGAILDAWIAPLFDDSLRSRRIRLATCMLADVAWQASPDFRADRALEMALHGNWIAITAAERVMMAQALGSSFGRDRLPDMRLTSLCTEEELQRARQWGHAIRFAQRLSAGVGSVLETTGFQVTDEAIELQLPRREAALLSDPVVKRLERLSEALDRPLQVDYT